MLDNDFLTKLLSKDDVSAEDKISQILAERDADERGLIQKRDELLGAEKKLKEQIKTMNGEKSDYETKLSGLEEELKKATSEDHKKYYETQIADLTAKYESQVNDLTTKCNSLEAEKLNNLRDKTVAESIKNYSFIDGLKDGFVSRVMTMNNFEAKDIDGEIKFLNKDNHTIDETIKAFALTPEGKCYIKNPSAGGGASGSGNNVNSKSISRTQFDGMNAEDKMAFIKKGGEIIDG